MLRRESSPPPAQRGGTLLALIDNGNGDQGARREGAPASSGRGGNNHDSRSDSAYANNRNAAPRSPREFFGANEREIFGGNNAHSQRRTVSQLQQPQRMYVSESDMSEADAMMLPAYSDVCMAGSAGAKFEGSVNNFGGNHDAHARTGARHLSLHQTEIFGANDDDSRAKSRANFCSPVAPQSRGSVVNLAHMEKPAVNSGGNTELFPGKYPESDQNVLLQYLAMKKERLSQLTSNEGGDYLPGNHSNERVSLSQVTSNVGGDLPGNYAKERVSPGEFTRDRSGDLPGNYAKERVLQSDITRDRSGDVPEDSEENTANMSHLSMPTEAEVCVCMCVCMYIFVCMLCVHAYMSLV
jgi:hypothetical protein